MKTRMIARIALATCVPVVMVVGTDYTWVLEFEGEYDNANSWDVGTGYPDTCSKNAILVQVEGSAVEVTLDANETVGELTITDDGLDDGDDWITFKNRLEDGTDVTLTACGPIVIQATGADPVRVYAQTAGANDITLTSS